MAHDRLQFRRSAGASDEPGHGQDDRDADELDRDDDDDLGPGPIGDDRAGRTVRGRGPMRGSRSAWSAWISGPGDWLGRFGLGRILVTVSGGVLAVLVGLWMLRPGAPPAEANLPFAAAATTESGAAIPTSPSASPTASSSVAPDVVVHVAGAVVSPGVYALAGTARVDDAVRAAGGPAPDADLDAINRAAPVADGQRIYIVRVGETAPVTAAPPAGAGDAGGAAATPPGPVDLNRAGATELDALPGVGPATAAAIVAHREANGPFASVDDLEAVRGIGPAKLEALRPLVTV